MEGTFLTWIVAIAGLLIMGILMAVQFVAVIRPRDRWTIDNVYGGDPESTDPTAYFAFNRGMAWADVFFWGPLQIAGSIGMLFGQRLGFLLALAGSVPFIYSAFLLFIWDRDLGYRKNTLSYWFIWVIFPAYGVVEMVYCVVRLLG